LIPPADDDELQDLTDDIRAHGLVVPIVLFEGMILDGRNRAAACERAGITPRYVLFEGGREDALILVVSHNLKRRHLTKQAIAHALVGAEDFNLHYTSAEPAEAGADSPEAQSVIKITEPKTASSRKLAQAAGRAVSHVMIAATRKVKETGEPELQEAVKRGALACKTRPRRPTCRPSSKGPLPGRQNQGERRRRPPRRRRARSHALMAPLHEARSTSTRRCARRGRRQRHCAASGRQRTTEPKNGLSARFCSIWTSLANRPGSYQSPLAIRDRVAKASPGKAAAAISR
jgi:hypothetical protein